MPNFTFTQEQINTIDCGLQRMMLQLKYVENPEWKKKIEDDIKSVYSVISEHVQP